MLEIEFLVDHFCYQQFKHVTHCLLASMLSDVKSAINLSKDHLCVTNCFHLAAFKILSLFDS